MRIKFAPCPRIAACCRASPARSVLEICQSLGLETNNRVIKPGALRNAKGIFITQSALGIVPVAVFNGEPVAPSPLVERVSRSYGEMVARP